MRERVSLWSLLLVCLVAGVMSAEVRHVVVAVPPVDTTFCAGEVEIPVEIRIDSYAPAMRADFVEVHGTVTPQRDAMRLVLRYESDGAVAIYNPWPRQAGSVTAGMPISFSFLARIGQEGAVHVWADLQFQPEGEVWSRRGTMYALRANDRLYTGGGSMQHLRMAVIRDDQAAGAIDAAEAERRMQALAVAPALLDSDPSRIRRRVMTDEGVVTAMAVEAQAVPSDMILVQGNVLWTDQNGNTHAVYRALVRIRDSDTLGDETVAEVYTDTDGNYSALIDDDDGFLQGDRDVYVQVRSENSWVDVQTSGGDTYVMQSGIHDETPGGSTITENFTDGGDSFGVFQGATWAGRYASDLNGGGLSKLTVHWPSGFDGSFYDGDLELEQDDRWDWDTIHHEFGHFVMDELDIENNPGGPHNIGDCAASARGDKSEGNRLAWGEGWPTYWGTAGQDALGLASLNIPRVGDTQYDDLEDTSVSYSIESNNTTGIGEDNEVAVQRLLWDLYDSNADGRDQITRSDQSIWDAIDAADPTILSSAWAALRGGQSAENDLLMGEIASDHRVGPRLVSPGDGAIAGPSQTYSWNRDVGCDPSFDGDSFELRFYRGNTLVLALPGIAGNSSSISAAQYDALVAGGHSLKWAVEGRNGSSPATGPYLGESFDVILNRPPVADAGADQVVECASHGTTQVSLSGAGSSDPDGDTLTYEWSAPGVVFATPNAVATTGQFPKGNTIVTLTVSDGIQEDTDTMLVSVVDTTPPDISCPIDVTAECTGNLGVDADDPQLAAFFAGASATDTCDATPAITNDAPAFFPLGATIVTFTATDASGNSSSCQATVTVVDTTPPEITMSLDTASLWPANHKLATVNATVAVVDECDPGAYFLLTSITSNEPDNGLGDGDQANDIQGADFGTPDLQFQLRMERSGLGSGRIYTVTYTAYDSSGNSTPASAQVVVPHSMR